MIVACTGHRPDKLGGYTDNHPIRAFVKEWFLRTLKQLAPDKCISGMAQGADQDFAEACVVLGIPFIAAVPLKAQAAPWNKSSRDRYLDLLGLAADVVVLSDDDCPWSEAMQVRNEYLVDESDRMLAVWDGSHGGTGSCVRYARKMKRKIDFMPWDEMKSWALAEDLAERSPLCDHDDPAKCQCKLVFRGFTDKDD